MKVGSIETQETLKLDQIMKVLFKMSKTVTLDLVNALFKEKFSLEEVSLQY